MKRYLVVANQTAATSALRQTLAELAAAGPAAFTLVVPATHPRDHLSWTEGSAQELARRRLDEARAVLAEQRIAIEGWIGDENPYLAIADAFLEHDFDEVVLSTLPRGRSRWRRMDLARRVQEEFGVPVRTVTSEPVAARPS